MFSDEFWKALPNMKGTQLWIVAFVFVVVAILLIARIVLVPGATRAASQEKKEERDAAQDEENRRDTIAVMQKQIHDLQEEVRDLKRDLERRSRVEERDREYRHALANQAQALIAAVERDRELLSSIQEEWPEMPRHFRNSIAALKTPAQIIATYPLPAPLQPEAGTPEPPPAS